ncbi:polyphosphate:AMP phosphotransferase [Usitatibacter palustris]|uniref:Polyphosphate:AMP phosphotransferase n=1 Tax=Usitatibacter palustris TaxID=2732487 RepID=A0A6M4HA39_9PROT|nr:polyphosphate:AMP phosphotransferase [Usitatibacter palustris]QJR16649.1 Polyphosphate:AMP phosphotransferase [Usitatibacter palustris]
MFESAEIGHKLDKARYKREEPKLRRALLEAQYELLKKPESSVLVIVGGVDGSGKGETVNLFNEWMDPRHIRSVAFGPPTNYERERGEMWRYWQSLPGKGRIGIFFASWYTDPVVSRVTGRMGRAAFARSLERIRRLEFMLAAEGIVLVKLWFHLSKKAQRDRFRKLSANKRTAWRVTRQEWKNHKSYDKFRDVSEDALRETSTGAAPWHVIDGSDNEYRSLTAGRILLDALRHRLDGEKTVIPAVAPVAAAPLDGRNILRALDYKRTLTRAKYDERLDELQAKLAYLSRGKAMRNRSLVLCFEGMDAAGKGSTIRRITQALDSRHYRVIPVAAPTEEERAQPYLWRFWRHMPGHGQVAIFDRSWYGRVLVERVEKFASEIDWMRAYQEINEFESQLVESGAVVVKFWMAITPEEQLKRFKARADTPHKQFKITAEDWRNRKKWPAYERAVCDMIERTSTDPAPWHLIAATDKLHARIEVLEKLTKALS